MSTITFAGLTIFIFALIALVGAVLFLKQAGLRILAVAGIAALLLAGGIAGFSYQMFNDQQARAKVAQEERERAREEELAEQKRKQEAEDAARLAAEEKAKKEAELKKKDGNKGKEREVTPKVKERVQFRKIREWNELGRALSDVENDLGRDVVEIDEKMKKVSLAYEQGKISSYEELQQRATLGLKRQERILKALDEKSALLKAAVLISDEEKKYDRELLEKRRAKALEDKEKYQGMLNQVEENSDVFKTL